MKRAETLKEFTHLLIAYVGSGYCYYKITHIPNKKAYKSPQILLKVSEHYQTNLSQGKRQYKRKQGKANYAAVNYRDMIIVLHTSGEHIDNPNEFKELTKKGIELKLSKLLTLILFKDERNKWTYRLGKNTYLFFTGELESAFKNSNSKKFYTLKSMFNHLPHYIGIGKQKKELNIYIKKIQKDHKSKKEWGLF
jgi:hypothetical protein